MKNIGLFLGLCLSVTAMAAPIQGIHFSYKDWEVACDNTGTCRMAGYHNDEHDDSHVISVLLTRPAGTETITGKIKFGYAFGENDEIAPKSGHLRVNQRDLGVIRLNEEQADLSPEQIRLILQAVKGTGSVEIVAGRERFVLSNAGATTVWTKMQEFQQNGKLKPQAKPIIWVVKPSTQKLKPLNAAQQKSLLAQFQQKVSEDTCHQLHDKDEQHTVDIYPLTPEKVLAETLCWRGAYNATSILAIVNVHTHRLEKIVNTQSTDYEAKNGEIFTSMKGRGLGDCWGGENYRWDGKQFVLTYAHKTEMCRGFLGNAWTTPTFDSIVKEKK